MEDREAEQDGEVDRCVRPEMSFRDFVTVDDSSGFEAEESRYHLYISWGCPWAHRTAIMRKLKGLEDVVSLSATHPVTGEEG